MTSEQIIRKPRGLSPRGDFELSKQFATESENGRRDSARIKSEALKELRLKREREQAESS